MIRNKFIVIEGIEGSGKTEACRFVMQILQERQINDIISVREPGSTPISEKLRQLVKNNIYNKLITKKTELLLMYAARVQLVDTIIRPSLSQGKWVISDRHDLSSLAYQGGGLKINTQFIIKLKKMLLGNFKPDLTIYLDVIPEIGLKRIYSRKKIDRIEKKSLQFFIRVRNSYLKFIASNPDSITINASYSKKIVKKSIRDQLHQWLQNQNI